MTILRIDCPRKQSSTVRQMPEDVFNIYFIMIAFSLEASINIES